MRVDKDGPCCDRIPLNATLAVTIPFRTVEGACTFIVAAKFNEPLKLPAPVQTSVPAKDKYVNGEIHGDGLEFLRNMDQKGRGHIFTLRKTRVTETHCRSMENRFGS